jgi:hypothetical protein
MSLLVDHPDFSLVFTPGTPRTGQGVAKTQEGVKALLALWGIPKDDPDHPLCVFSWTPTPDALAALSTHFPKARVCQLAPLDPLRNTRTHAKTAWLTAPTLPSEPRFKVTHETGETCELCVEVTPGVFPPVMHLIRPDRLPVPLEGVMGFSHTNTAFFWDRHTMLRSSSGVLRFSEDVACAFCTQVLSLAPPGHAALFSGHALEDAYESAKTHTPCSAFTQAFWLGRDEAWAHPLLQRNMHAFFSSDTPPRGVDHVPDSQFLRFRAVASHYSEAQQRDAWERTLREPWADYKKPVILMMMLRTSPKVGAEHLLTAALKRSKDALAQAGVVETVLKKAVCENDTGLLEALSRVRCAPSRTVLTFFSAVDRLCKKDTQWHSVACLWAYHEGFQQKDSPEGVASFSHALCAYTPSVFKEPLSAFLSPSMREALHESNFVKALDAVGVGAP